MDPVLLRFYADQARQWLERELPEGDWSFTTRANRITLGRRYQLRLAPDACRWLLLRGSPRRWRVPPCQGPCTSLVDWLRQIRRLENRPRPRKQEVMTFKRNRS